ncbi:MAG TPA: hypothetical protein VIT91_17110 [Chthoniobacterales bacterium]
MKSAAHTLLAFAFYAFAAAAVLYASDKPDPETFSTDSKRLDALMQVFSETQARGDQFGNAFWRASKRLAEERGTDIIHAVMERSQKWQGEEGLIFVPLVALLPREAALKILHQYQRSKRESESVWAEEFITELDMSDTKEAVRKYSMEK